MHKSFFENLFDFLKQQRSLPYQLVGVQRNSRREGLRWVSI